ncbi:MAG: SH3 domain-containing protein [Caldilineaceae bacterium]|nr:SH3 domain-containing protein [Caldilineaceae bacterium]
MQRMNYDERPGFGRGLASLLEGSAATVVSLILIPALLAVALLLPPVSLLDRIQGLAFTSVSDAGGTLTDPDGTALIFPAEAVDSGFRASFQSIPRADFVSGNGGEEWRSAIASLPNSLQPKSPLYHLTLRGDEPQKAVLQMPIPNDSEPYETLDLYTWTGDKWAYLPSTVVRTEDRVFADFAPDIPANFVLMQSAAPLPRVGVNVGLSGQLPAFSDSAVATVAVAGLYLRGDGALDGETRGVPPGNYDILPVVRNWMAGEMPRIDLLNNMLVDAGLQENQINAVADRLLANNLPGVIIDYRGVDAEPGARADFAAFVTRLAERLHSPEINKSLAVRVETPRQISAEEWETAGYDWLALAAAVDRLIVPAPVDPRAYQPGGEMDALLAWATDHIDRNKLQIELPSQSVERSGNYLLLKGYQEALQPLVAQIQSSTDNAAPGEVVNISLDNPRILSSLTFEEKMGSYWYSYVDDQGFERTVYLEHAGSFAHKLNLLQRYNVTQAILRDADSGDIDPNLWDVARQFQVGPVSGGATLAVAYTVINPDGSVLAQETRPLDNTGLSFAAPAGQGALRIEAQIVENNRPVSGVSSRTVTLGPGAVGGGVPEPEAAKAPEAETANLSSDQIVNVRQGPGTQYPIVGTVDPGVTYRVLGKNQAQDWWQIELKNGTVGWAIGSLTSANGAANSVAVVTDIPAPPEPVAAAPAAAAAAAAPAPAAAPVAVSGPAPTGGGSFGYGVQAHMVHNDQAGQVMNMTKGMGFGWVKQQVEWKVFEPNPGDFQWGALDGIINAANSSGVSLLFSTVNSPPWAREPGFDGSVGGPPQDPQTFANFNGALAGKYCGSALKAIEVWNEQNLHYEWGNKPLNPGEYVRLLAASYASIKAACPSMLVISGALTPAGNNGNLAMDDFAYLDGMFAAGVNNYADGIGAHPSGYNVPPSQTGETACAAIQVSGNSFNGACDSPHHSWSFRSTMEGYRQRAVNAGASNKLIWPTEFGWAAGGAYHPAYAYANDNDFGEQAAWTVEAYQMMRNWGWAGPAFLWNLNFRVVADGTEKAQWGIVSNNWSPLPVYNALRDMPK